MGQIAHPPAGKSPRIGLQKIPKILLNTTDRGVICLQSQCAKTALESVAPASSMPNLALEFVSDATEENVDTCQDNNQTISRDKIEVYCSPRMLRRSMHLDPTFQDSPVDGFCWFEAYDPTSSLSLSRSVSRVGSAVSLNSEFTTHSIGMLSSDSTSDLLQQQDDKHSDVGSQKPGHLRRHLSNPESSCNHDYCMSRNTRSWTNLKEAAQGSTENHTIVENKLTKENLNVLHLPTDNLDRSTRDQNNEEEGSDQSTLVRAKTDHQSLRDLRVQQWLRDIPRAPLSGLTHTTSLSINESTGT